MTEQWEIKYQVTNKFIVLQAVKENQPHMRFKSIPINIETEFIVINKTRKFKIEVPLLLSCAFMYCSTPPNAIASACVWFKQEKTKSYSLQPFFSLRLWCVYNSRSQDSKVPFNSAPLSFSSTRVNSSRLQENWKYSKPASFLLNCMCIFIIKQPNTILPLPCMLSFFSFLFLYDECT